MLSASITVASIERVEGISKKTQKPYTKFVVHAADTSSYATFDAALANIANGGIGRGATVHYESGQYGNDLKGITIDTSTPVQAPPSQAVVPPTQQAAPTIQRASEPDWQKIGLQKTRCALWAALFSGETLRGMPETAALVMGVALVRGAEADIFCREPASAPDDFDGLPF